ncbi:MAG: enoyl-CoA hydratase-related protein [Xanthobacteraceae bacterium]|jgi:enoyl-CoA hydratase/carnithine racemase
MSLTTILYDTADRVARITLNRPERLNAMNQLMLDDIGRALDDAERDTGVRVVLVTGAGSAFSSGFDLKEQMESRPTGTAQWRGILRRDFDTIMRFWRFPKPTIATVRGACLAGACELAMACDITIAAEDAFFGEPELKFGAGIVAMILPWMVGPKRAKEIIFTGEDRIAATRARDIGMVNRVVPSADLDAEGLALARHIAVVEPELMRQTKRAINQACEARSMAEALSAALDIDLEIEGAGSPDKIAFMDVARREGLRAAIAWRDARFASACSGEVVTGSPAGTCAT